MSSMQFLVYVIDLCLLAALTTWASKLARKADKFDEYEFNNATEGGVVQHKSFRDSRAHQLGKVKSHLALTVVSGLAIITSLVLIALGAIGFITFLAYWIFLVWAMLNRLPSKTS